MSETTIQVPPAHVEAIRRSLIGRHRDAGRPEEIGGLIEQIERAAADASQPLALTGSRTVLWSALYDALCAAAEQLADDCNEYWRGSVDADSAREGVATVGARLELLVALGAPPRR